MTIKRPDGSSRAGSLTSWRCPRCPHTLDVCTQADGATEQPNPGDVAVCFQCAGVFWRINYDWRPITEPERDSLDPRVRLRLDELASTRAEIIHRTIYNGRLPPRSRTRMRHTG